MIDNNLLVQILVVLVTSFLFLVALEGFGFLANRAIGVIAKRVLGDTQAPLTNAIENLYIGGLAYALLFFMVGLLGILSATIVIILSVAIPLLAFIVGKRWVHTDKIFISVKSWPMLGGIIFLTLTFFLWFRPITNFDGLWYHLTIPKLFLQHGSINDLGTMLSYSVQPSITYFWNLLPLSLPISTAVAGIIVNTVSAVFFSVSLVYATITLKKMFGWSKATTLLVPLLVGSTYEVLRLLGTGGNDLIGASYALVAVISITSMQHKGNIRWQQIITTLLLVIGLASTKVFFLILATLLVTYLVIGSWGKLASNQTVKKRLLIFTTILAVVFLVTFLPWLVRSYLATGKILYPLGVPGFNEAVYKSEGGGSLINHWTKFVFERFNVSIIPMLTSVYSPLVLIGILAIYSRKIQEKISSMWIVSLVGFIGVYFASIALQWRYYLPSAILLVLIGIVVVIEFTKKQDIFGKFILLCLGFVLIFTSIGRVVWSASDNSGLPSINGDIYVSNFKGTRGYLNDKLSIGTYDYVQEVSPADLGPDETIFIGNSFLKPLPIYGMMKLAYVDNPFLERTVDSDKFSQVKTSRDFQSKLRELNIRYVLTHDKPSDICKIMGISDYKTCDDVSVFQPVLFDKKWEVNWYKVTPP